ncbi:MAG: AI-2E family transporter [Bacteroidota bacterium]
MNQTLKSFFSIVGIILGIYLLWTLRLIISYILIAVVLSLIINPIVAFIHNLKIWKIKFSYNLSLSLAMMLIISLGFGFISIFAPVLAEQSRIISNINIDILTNTLKEPLSTVESFINQYQLTDNPEQSAQVFIQEKLKGIVSTVNLSSIISNLISAMGSITMALCSIMFITFFFIKDRDLFTRAVFSITPDKYMNQAKEIMRNSRTLLSRYFIGIAIEIILITTIMTIGLSIFGIKNAFAIGFFAGIINVIPYVGPLIGASFGILISITSNLNMDFHSQMIPMLIKVCSVYITVQLLDGFLFQPFIFSNSVKSHPLEIFIVILSAATFAGITGMIVAVPLYSFIRIIAKEFFFRFKIIQSITKDI